MLNFICNKFLFFNIVFMFLFVLFCLIRVLRIETRVDGFLEEFHINISLD